MIMNADLCPPFIGLATRMLKYFQKHYIKNLLTSILTLGLRITEVLRCHSLSSFVVTLQTFNFIVYVKGQIYNLCNQPRRRSFFIHIEFWYLQSHDQYKFLITLFFYFGWLFWHKFSVILPTVSFITRGRQVSKFWNYSRTRLETPNTPIVIKLQSIPNSGSSSARKKNWEKNLFVATNK